VSYRTPNKKQVGSNIGSLDHSSGMCPSHCELCFVNYSRLAYYKYLLSEKRQQEARKAGWTGGPYLIPRSYDQAFDCFVRSVECSDGNVYPLIMRSGSNHCSAYPPKSWTRKVRDAWGDYLFFNVSVRSIAAKKFGGHSVRHNLDSFHKLVVTVNGGHQLPRRPVVGGTKEEKEKRRISGILNVQKSFGSRGPGDFMSPQSLHDIELPGLQTILKWYRLRVLPTVRPRFETDLPVVGTVLRFRGSFDAVAFARKYGFGIEVETGDRRVAAGLRLIDFEPIFRPGPTIIKIWDNSDENDSDLAGEASYFYRSRSFYRADNEPLADFPWVCDRSGFGCQACGLCASLDGTYPGAVNPLNPIEPIPYQMGYIMPVDKPKALENPAETGDSVFRSILEDIPLRNPPGRVGEMDLTFVNQALSKIGRYRTGEGHWDDGWNTWEDADALLSYCFWVSLRRRIKEFEDGEDAFEQAEMDCLQMSGVPNLCAGDPELHDLLSDEGRWFEMFGSIYDGDDS